MAVDSLVEALSRQPSYGYMLPAVQVPKYKADADWRLFKAEFKQTMNMADLKPSLQRAHLRQAVPEEAKKLVYQEQIDTVERAFEVLTELFEPHKDSSTLMEEILKITQQPKERLRALAGRIEEAETLRLPQNWTS